MRLAHRAALRSSDLPSYEEVARLLHCSIKTVRRAVNAGETKIVRSAAFAGSPRPNWRGLD